MGLFGSKDQVTKSSTVPWGPAQPYLKHVMGRAQGLYNQRVGFKAPNFQTFVPFSGQTKGALSGMWNAAQGGNPLAGLSENALTGILSGDISGKYGDLLSGTDNPHWGAAVQNQSDQIANDVQRQFSGLGRMGSAADTGALVDQLGHFREQALSDHWDQNIANQRGILGDIVSSRMGAINASPGVYDQRFAPYERMAQVGSAYDDLASRQLQSRIDKFNTSQSAPWNRLQAYYGMVGGPAGMGSSSTTTVRSPSNWFGGLMSGAQTGAQLGTSTGLGAGFGALGGGLLGLLSGL
jgi:hypothetical protein